MATQRFGVFTLTVLTATGLALGGCSSSSPGTGGSTPAAAISPSPAPRQDLMASIKELSTTSFKFSSATGTALSTSGAADPVKKAGTVTAKGTVQGVPIKMQVIGVDGDFYVTVDMGARYNRQLGVTAGQWMHLSPAKLGASANLPFDFKGGDLLDLKSLLDAVSEVQHPDATTYTGLIDLTAVSGVSSYSQEDLNKLGPRAKTMPFTATVDGEGRLVKVAIDASAVDKELTNSYTFSDFGAPVTITKPAKVKEAPASVYDFFKN